MSGHTFFAAAGQVQKNENELLFVLVQIAVVILSARLLGSIAKRLGQPRVVGEILGGLFLGPTLLGHFAPGVFDWLFHSTESSTLYFFSQVGLLLLMLQIGMEFDFSHLRDRKNRRTVFAVTFGSILLPFAGGFGLGWLMHPVLAPDVNPVAFCLFVAVALSITALPILGRIMIDFGITRTRLGSVTISSAALNDIVGWILLAAITTLATSAFSPGKLALQIAGIAAFALLCWFIVRPPLCKLARKEIEKNGEVSLNFAAILSAAAFLAGAITIKLGIFAIFGGFIIGVLLFDQRSFVESWHRRMAPFVEFFFLPIFFTYTGLRTDAGGLGSVENWLWCAAVIGVATITKLAGSYVAARWSGLPISECRCLAVMMNTRALMELIVLNVGYDLGIIPPPVFTMLVFMAIATTIITSPLLRRLLPGIKDPLPAS